MTRRPLIGTYIFHGQILIFHESGTVTDVHGRQVAVPSDFPWPDSTGPGSSPPSSESGLSESPKGAPSAQPAPDTQTDSPPAPATSKAKGSGKVTSKRR